MSDGGVCGECGGEAVVMCEALGVLQELSSVFLHVLIDVHLSKVPTYNYTISQHKGLCMGSEC